MSDCLPVIKWDTTLLLPRISATAASMREKFVFYKQDQLPGGKYWNPNEEVQAILKELKPQNNICESLLGLNNCLTTPLVTNACFVQVDIHSVYLKAEFGPKVFPQ